LAIDGDRSANKAGWSIDGALLLARDRPDGLRYEASLVHPATPALWG